MSRATSYMLLAITMGACGGGDDVPSTIEPESVYAQRCVTPRTGMDPASGTAFTDVKGRLLDEQLWLRSWIDNTYLWYKEVPKADPKQFMTALAYFDILKTGVTTPSGKPKDQFHFTYTTPEWEALSQSGVEASYGFQLAIILPEPPATLPRRGLIADVEANTPATDPAVHFARGAEIKFVDGVDLANGNTQEAVDKLNQGLFPAGPGETHTFVVVDPGSTATRTVTLTSASVESLPVKFVAKLPPPNDTVGYMLFNDHIATAEKGLVDAVTKLAGVTDLVLDMRYNGGGYLAIAAQLAYMLADPTKTNNKVFEREMFNDKYPTTDPVTGRKLTPFGFIDETVGLSLDPGQKLPNLPLKRVFVLTGRGTCSASEAVMNGLAGVGIEVIQIGATTCGKPYGFYPTDNCGTTYFAIQFQGVNEMGFGDYADGFVPGGVFHGCKVADDFTHALGDPAEGRLAAALNYRTTSGQCPPVAAERKRAAANPLSAIEGTIPKPPWRQNRILIR